MTLGFLTDWRFISTVLEPLSEATTVLSFLPVKSAILFDAVRADPDISLNTHPAPMDGKQDIRIEQLLSVPSHIRKACIPRQTKKIRSSMQT